MRRATAQKRYHGSPAADFYPRSPCGERLDTSVCIFCKARISIHALLAESDTKQPPMTAPPRQFLSTLSLRRATPRACPVSSRRPYFYPRSPCGERLHAPSHSLYLHNISIHALLAESDQVCICMVYYTCKFLSTLSLRRATGILVFCGPQGSISIHALLAESDQSRAVSRQKARNFYPRSPCGERPMQIVVVVVNALISIHALLAESDVNSIRLIEHIGGFLSTLSLRRATSAPRITPAASRNFYPRSPCGERQRKIYQKSGSKTFLSTLSLRRAT